MGGFKVGVSLRPQVTSVADLRRAWTEADRLGVDSIWIWDHFFPLFGDGNGGHFECWTLLAALAVDTQRAQIGPMVSCAAYRNPDLLALMAGTVDHLSGGRLVLGLGAGWFERDFKEYGYEFGTPASRLRMLAKALPRIKARLPRLRPQPPGRVPILIGGGGEKVTLRLVAEHADAWNGFGPASAYRRRVRVLREWCEKAGRDFESIERTANTRSPEDWQSLVEAGCQHVVVSLGHPFDLAPVQRLLEARG